MAGYQRFGELAEIVGLNWAPMDQPERLPHVELKAECGQARRAYRADASRRVSSSDRDTLF